MNFLNALPLTFSFFIYLLALIIHRKTSSFVLPLYAAYVTKISYYRTIWGPYLLIVLLVLGYYLGSPISTSISHNSGDSSLSEIDHHINNLYMIIITGLIIIVAASILGNNQQIWLKIDQISKNSVSDTDKTICK